MPKVTDSVVLLAYAEGNDLHDHAPLIRDRLQDMVLNHGWRTSQVAFVDQVEASDPATPTDLPDWSLGINLGLDHLGSDEGWFADIQAIVNVFAQIHRDTGRDFVLCVAYHDRPELQEHLCFVDSRPADLPFLRNAIERLIRLR